MLYSDPNITFHNISVYVTHVRNKSLLPRLQMIYNCFNKNAFISKCYYGTLRKRTRTTVMIFTPAAHATSLNSFRGT